MMHTCSLASTAARYADGGTARFPAHTPESIWVRDQCPVHSGEMYLGLGTRYCPVCKGRVACTPFRNNQCIAPLSSCMGRLQSALGKRARSSFIGYRDL